MSELDARIFERLFRDAYQRCFSRAFTAPLSEAESHHFSVEIAEAIGLEIGWKSLKNYSHYLADSASAKPENPSTSTLDTLARYVAGAPAADDQQRRKGQRHYPYWFRYQEAFRKTDGSQPAAGPTITASRRVFARAALAVASLGITALLVIAVAHRQRATETFSDEFDDVADSTLAKRGWRVQSMEGAHWAQRAVKPGHLTLFTLSGDNWPQEGMAPGIKNLLVRRSPPGCFVAEARLTGFFPKQNWQQAGLLLLEDTLFTRRSLRLSVGYNDFAGGFPATREIIVQAISALGQDFSKPEELAHQRLFALEAGSERTVADNLASVALRIEKYQRRFRLLYSAGPMENAAFKEVVSRDFDLEPAFVAVFALKGFVNQSDDMPVYVDGFRVTSLSCVG